MDDDLVHLGIWQDFSGGKYKGWNLTTTNQQATILTAFTAIGVTAVGARSWKIYRFLLYQSRRHDIARDAMIREQEVILRNSKSDLCTLTNVWSLIWAWRSFGRLLPGDKLRKSHRSSASAARITGALGRLPLPGSLVALSSFQRPAEPGRIAKYEQLRTLSR